MLYGKLEMEELYGPDVVAMSRSSYIPGGTTTILNSHQSRIPNNWFEAGQGVRTTHWV